MSNQAPKYTVVIDSLTLLQRAAVDAYQKLLEQQAQADQSTEREKNNAQSEFNIWGELYAKESGETDEAVALTKLANLALRYNELANLAINIWIISCETGGTSDRAKQLAAEALHNLRDFAAERLALDPETIAERVKHAHDNNCPCERHA